MLQTEEIKYLKQQVEFYRRDYNTGLLGRHDFSSDIRKKFKEGKEFWLAMHDITGLHRVNREYGYSAGDSLIKQVANDLKLCTKPCEVYLIGGDEFMTLYCTKPTNIDVCDTTGAFMSSIGFTSVDTMIDAVDKLVIDKKTKLGRRREDLEHK